MRRNNGTDVLFECCSHIYNKDVMKLASVFKSTSVSQSEQEHIA